MLTGRRQRSSLYHLQTEYQALFLDTQQANTFFMNTVDKTPLYAIALLCMFLLLMRLNDTQTQQKSD